MFFLVVKSIKREPVLRNPYCLQTRLLRPFNNSLNGKK